MRTRKRSWQDCDTGHVRWELTLTEVAVCLLMMVMIEGVQAGPAVEKQAHTAIDIVPIVPTPGQLSGPATRVVTANPDGTFAMPGTSLSEAELLAD